MSYNEWKKVKLADIAEITMGQSPSGDNCNNVGKGLPLLNGPTEFGYSHPIAVQFTTDPKKVCDIGDILFCVRGSTGRMNWADKKYAIGRGLASIRHRNGKAYQHFIKGVIEYRLSEILMAATGSTFPNVSKDLLSSLQVDVPSLNEQKGISVLLSCLDAKIELNNRINKTLEEMAQAIFKQWFVDFDFPDENGQPYKSSGGEMEESELGLIPKGWKVHSLDNIANFLNGLAMQKYPPDYQEKGLAVLKIRELRQGRLDETSNRCSENIDRSYIVNDGDVIFSWSGSLLVDIWCGGKCGLNQHLFKVTSTSYKKWFYYLWTSYHLEKFIAIAQDKATTMGHIQRKHLKEAKVLLPETKTLAYMDSVMQPIINKIITGKLEIRTLANIRESLLPKLMSGEIRVPVEEQQEYLPL